MATTTAFPDPDQDPGSVPDPGSGHSVPGPATSFAGMWGCPPARERTFGNAGPDRGDTGMLRYRVPALSGSLALHWPGFFDSADCVTALEELARLSAWADAQKAHTIERLRRLNTEAFAAPHGPGAELADTATAVDAALALRIPERSAGRLVQESYALTNSYTATLTALQAGQISYRHATTILEEASSLPEGTPEKAAEARLLELAREHAPTVFAARARRLREREHPETITTRHRVRRAERRVEVVPDHDGMAWLHAYLPAEHACAIESRLDTYARHLKTNAGQRTGSGEDYRGDAPAGNGEPTGNRRSGKDRTLAQLRADVLADLLTHWCPATETLSMPHDGDPDDGSSTNNLRTDDGGPASRHHHGDPVSGRHDNSPASGNRRKKRGGRRHRRRRGQPLGKGIRAQVLITVPAVALAGLSDDPAELGGYGPIPIETARELAADAGTWQRILTDPVTGAALALDRARYTPTSGLRTWLRVRDKTCAFPGCNRSAQGCEIDHTIPWSRGGPTDHANLACVCKRHHHLKTFGVIHARQPAPGILTWTTPAGATYTRRPEPPPF